MLRQLTSRRISALAFVVAIGFATEVAPLAQRRPLTVERLASSPSLIGTAPTRPTWSPDSRWLAFLWNDAGVPTRDLWLVAGNGTAPRRLTQVAATGGAGARGSIDDFVWTPDGRAVLYLLGGDVWRVAVDGGEPKRLTADGGGKSDLDVSPDGRFMSFLKAGDLWLRTEQGVVTQATHVGRPPSGSVGLGTYNRPDVEIGRSVWGGDTPTYAWSPDSRRIAVHYVDRRHVRTVAFPYYLGEETTVNLLRRGYPGDENELRTIGLYDVAGASLSLLDLADPKSSKINDYSWSASGQLLIDRSTDTEVDRWLLLLADPQTRAVREVWHDHRESRVYTAVTSGWDADGKRILFVGDLDERYRLYSLVPGESTPKPLTSAAADVTAERGAARPTSIAATRRIFFVSTEASPYERHVYSMGADGGPATRITTKPGVHIPFVSPDGSALAVLHSDDVTPTELYLTDARGGAALRRITRSPPAEFGEHEWVKARYATFKSRIDNFTLHARILEPPNLDKSKKYPVIFGPVYSNTVRNRWAGLFASLQQLLVERGYIVVQVDVRGSTGYGRAFREKFLMDWGGGDLEDLQSAMEYLRTLGYVDVDRAGIWGSSYGGTLTVFSLFKKPGLFKAGVAGAPAVDPRFFGTDDVAITRTPKSQPEAFKRGNASEYAANLRDHLLIIQGMQDDVVPFKTNVALAEQLMRLGKDFDFAFAPAATHGWSQRDYYAVYLLRKLVAHFDRYLAAESR